MIRIALLSLFAATTMAVMPASAQFSSPIPSAPPPSEYIYAEAPTDHVLGSVDAPHTLILYASNVCPACGYWFANEWQPVKEELVETGLLRLVFRPLPTEPVQPSLIGFIMAECAPEGSYMDVIEDQFERQPAILEQIYSGASPKAEYDAIAAGAGLPDDAAISECLSNPDHMASIRKKGDWFAGAELTGVPSFIFDGEVKTGDHGVDDIRGWMDAARAAQ